MLAGQETRGARFKHTHRKTSTHCELVRFAPLRAPYFGAYSVCDVFTCICIGVSFGLHRDYCFALVSAVADNLYHCVFKYSVFVN